MRLNIFTPSKLVLERDVVSVTMPAVAGQITVMDGHDILITELLSGKLYFRWIETDGKPKREDYDTGGGIAEVTHDAVHIFVKSTSKANGF